MSVTVQLFSAFFGSLGFALLFNVRGRRILPAAAGGLLSWGVYLAMRSFGCGDVLSYILASVAMSLYAEIMAHATKSPATVYLVSAAIPLVPGGMLYETMRAGVGKQWDAFFQGTLQTLLLAMAIAGGILFGMTLVSVAKKIRYTLKKRRVRTQSGG